MSVRKRSELEAIQHLQWLLKQKDVDFGTMDYGTTEKYVRLDDNNKPTAFNHHHAGLIIESLAFEPESDAKTRLVSGLELLDNCIERARLNGLSEVYFMSSDERTDEAACKHRGFDVVKMLRKRI
jgi:N-acetylglutamate synthase-like GNAT family acetyltransferase